MTIEADAVRVFAPAKINLFLHVGEKRADGFHDLQSLVAFADVGDELSFSRADGLSLAIDGPFAKSLAGDSDNLVLRAARALAAKTGTTAGARIALVKNLPVASGIGGGSADAAAALRGLVRLWNIGIESSELHSIAETLGSDIPVCIASRAARMEGRGERVTPIAALPKMSMVLVNPGVAVATAQVFRALRSRRGVGLNAPPSFADKGALIDYLRTTGNDLEPPARSIAPVIGELLDELADAPGALLTRMSGSGATCFGLFDSTQSASAAADAIAEEHRGWWVAATALAQGVQ